LFDKKNKKLIKMKKSNKTEQKKTKKKILIRRISVTAVGVGCQSCVSMFAFSRFFVFLSFPPSFEINKDLAILTIKNK